MANTDDEEKKYLCSTGRLDFINQSRSHKNPDMVLNLGSKSDAFLSDQTPTPIRLLRKCEEIGLFQDMSSMNPFEETFRKATEDIRSGVAPLEISSLSVPNNADDSLHTPHVIFPLTSELNKRKGAISPREDLSIPIIHHDSSTLCIPLADDDPEKSVIQQEADTSEETQMSDLNVSSYGCEDESNPGTIQFLLRMPDGKMVKLSSLPVEQMDTTNSGSKDNDIPVIKVDSSFLKTVNDGGTTDSIHLSSLASTIKSNSYNNSFTSGVSNLDSRIRNTEHRASSPGKKNETEQFSKMSIAKQKLKQALMNNSCPATNLSSSYSVISSSVQPLSRPGNPEYKQYIEARRPSSQSDESEKCDDMIRNLSSVEEKRRRNRAAAMRCREKRKTWVKELEHRANEMLKTNGQLQHEVSMLRDEVAQLKTLLLAHRDCPVTQALVQGKLSLPSGTSLPKSAANTLPQSLKKNVNKDTLSSSPPTTIVVQSPVAANSVKPLILLNDPPVKRKRLNSTNNSGINSSSSASSLSVVSSPSSASVVHTLVLPPKTSNTFSSNFVNVIPSVLVANPATPTGSGAPQVIYSQILPGLPSIPGKAGVTVVPQRQPFILPKAQINPYNYEINLLKKSSKSEGKVRSTHLLSTNVIKVNPNVMERDSNDSDIEILDVKPIRS